MGPEAWGGDLTAHLWQPWAFEVFKPKHLPRQIQARPGNPGPSEGEEGSPQPQWEIRGTRAGTQACKPLSWNLASSDMPNCSRGSLPVTFWISFL